MLDFRDLRPARRDVLRALGAFAGAGLVRLPAQASEHGQAFSFDALTDRMRERAGRPYEPAQKLRGPLMDLTYDTYRMIAFRRSRARWLEGERPFHLHAFHPGWLYDEPVALHEVADGTARPMEFSTEDFRYHNQSRQIADRAGDLPGVSGFRLHHPLNAAGLFDELISFQGASYFRALGRGSAYGLSARGLAINTATSEPEEFPRFSAFWLVRPEPGADQATVFAALDSPSVTGAYAFDIRPGRDTEIDVTARLFFRRDVGHLGIAPLTSMFLYAEANRIQFNDYRPQVHDSDGLLIRRAGGDRLWRTLANPPALATSYFAETSPRGFGLHQRDRAFESYEDPGAAYHLRPSVDIDALGDWGDGAVRLIEIPTDLEINDNIVAYWTPRGSVAAGETREYRYRMRWGMLPPNPADDLAYATSVRMGVAGPSGVPFEGDARKFVIDFKGGRLPGVGSKTEVEPFMAATRGTVDPGTLAAYPVPQTGSWRLVGDVTPNAPKRPVELLAFLAVGGQKLTETWLYQWRPA